MLLYNVDKVETLTKSITNKENNKLLNLIKLIGSKKI